MNFDLGENLLDLNEIKIFIKKHGENDLHSNWLEIRIF